MQSNILQRVHQPFIGQVTQVRNHVKMWPWRVNRSNRECYLDPTKTPYTDKHNMNEFIAASKKQRKDWQKVVYKDKDARFNNYRINDTYKSNPVEAKQTARTRLDRFKNSLMDRGSAREALPYNPPEGVEERIIALYKTVQPDAQTDSPDAIFLNQSIELKFNLIKRCIEEFGHDLPNSYLTDIETISDLIEYYSTPVRGVNPYTALLRQEDSLPVNLALIAEPLRFNRETDTFFGGHSALPGLINKVPGLRGSKKYPIFNQEEFQWPDI